MGVVGMKASDRPSFTATADAMKALDEQNKARQEAIRRGDPVSNFQVHCPLTVEISQEGSAAVKFLGTREPDGTGVFYRMHLTPEATQTLRAILSASEKIPDGLPATPDPKQAN
jgi:hypothetical protein